MRETSTLSANARSVSVKGMVLDISPVRLSLAGPQDYYTLMKPRVMSLVVFTALAGLICAPGSMNPLLALASVFWIAVGGGAAGALNMWYDSDIDAMMTRTRKRPIPAGKITRSSALSFGIFMSGFSVFGLSITANYYAGLLLAFTILYYVFFYSMWLKRNTPQNIVIGGVAGAFPPMVGWAAAAGGTTGDPVSLAMLMQAITPESLALFMVIFLWTPPHFWALALYKQIDYGKANIPMMPNVKGAKSTRNQMMVYALMLALACAYLGTTSLSSPLYTVPASLLNIGFLALTFKVWRSCAGDTPPKGDQASLYAVKKGDKAARNLFAYSIFYLFSLFGILAAAQILKGF
ncbi:MAG: heme o synthase [Robiginitomaculum sp.]